MVVSLLSLLALCTWAWASLQERENFLSCANQVKRVCWDEWDRDGLEVHHGGSLYQSREPATRDTTRVCVESLHDVPAERFLERKGFRLTLGNGSHVHDASFQPMDEDMHGPCCPVDRYYIFRDYYAFNIVAYRLSSAFGCPELVPVSVERQFDRLGRGALTWWVDDVVMDAHTMHVLKHSVPHQDRAFALVALMSDLFGDIDRNSHNVLFTRSGSLRLIDWTMAFRRNPELREPHRHTRVERVLWNGLRNISLSDLKRLANGWLEDEMLTALESRRAELVARLSERIVQHGEASVIWPHSSSCCC